MERITANGVELHYEVSGDGEPLVLVHGSWSDHGNWELVAPELARSGLVVAYDRRGHGRSERPDRGTRRDHENDLAGLIEGLGRGPARVVGTSYGAMTAIGLATRRPELVSAVVAHEPPFISVVAGDAELQPLVARARADIAAVIERLRSGDLEGGAEMFVERVALGPGAWELLPQPVRETMIDTAFTFALEQQDPDWGSIAPDALAAIECPVLLTKGDASPEWFYGIVDGLAETIPTAEVHTYPGAGHAPHITHPADHIAAVSAYLGRSREPLLAA